MTAEFKTILAIFVAFLVIATLGPRDASGADQKPRDGTPPQTEKSASQTGFDLDPWSVDGGGGEAGGGTFTIVAAVGQHDAGLVTDHGTVIDGGVWSISVDLVFRDDFESVGIGMWSNAIPSPQPFADTQTPGGE
jgi:hypothetical protein